MSGRSPRWIQAIVKEISVTLSGTFHPDAAYATIDGTKYTAAGTVQGEDVRVYISGTSGYTDGCFVAVDGVHVQDGAGEYQYTGKSDINVAFNPMFSSYGSIYWTCEITTV